MINEEIIVFTDGSSRGNPGPGGYGAVVATPSMVVEVGGSESETTNNRMEIMAAYKALSQIQSLFHKDLTEGSRGQLNIPPIKIYSDSTYVVKGITQWIHAWMKRDWKTMTKDPVEHQELWEGLHELNTMLKPKWFILKGHSGIPGNERCDVIATAFADGKTPKLYNGSRSGYEINLSPASDKLVNSSTSSSKSKKNAPAYSYVALIDGKIYTYKNWKDCEAAVKGKSGVKYKKVFSANEERSLISEWA